MKTLKLKKSDVGRFIRVGFSDVGAVDGVVTQVDGPNDFRFLSLSRSNGDQTNNGAPALALGKHITAEHSGLI